jgi:hypothetical protein
MAEIEIVERRKVEVCYIEARCGVRYWEDAQVNGFTDSDGSRIPFRIGDEWQPTIELETGIVLAWPKGTTADIHYKVCDAGTYLLLDATQREVARIDGYVPKIMAPGDEDHGFGDYIVMTIDGDGKIDNWNADLSDFARRLQKTERSDNG